MEHNESHKRDLKVQIREAFGRVVYTYTTHLKQAEFLVKKNKRIRIWQIFLSAISTGGFLGAIASDEVVMTWVAGIVSTILLALNLFFKEFDLAGDISSHRATAHELWIIREQYISLLTDFSVLSEDIIMERRDKLQESTVKVYTTARPTDHRSYLAAQKALKEDEEQFFDTEEIDQMLPEHLRESSRN